MSTRSIMHAAAALQIRDIYNMSETDRNRLDTYMTQHSVVPLEDDVYLHNSNPPAQGAVAWDRLNLLVFRGSGRSHAELQAGFSAVPDDRFPKPVIIRDNWPDKQVTTHMQTKSVLAWTKSFRLAAEYAIGCISGDLSSGVKPGYLHFCWVETGLDVVKTVREWEQEDARLSPPIDPGQQHEILTPTVPINRILASWELRKPIGGIFGQFYIANKIIHAGNFAAVTGDYNAISGHCPVGPENVLEYWQLGTAIDRLILL